MSENEIKEKLKNTNRFELRDHSFGDVEVEWRNQLTNDLVASAYYGHTKHISFYFDGGFTISGDDAAAFADCGTFKLSESNNNY